MFQNMSMMMMEDVDFNLLTEWMLAESFWDQIYVFAFVMILTVPIICLCGYERNRYGKKKKSKLQQDAMISVENNNNTDNKPPPPTAKIEPPQPPPPPYDPPQNSLCPEDTLHDVTSIAQDNETSIFMVSPDFSRTALTHSLKDRTQRELAPSPPRHQISN